MKNYIVKCMTKFYISQTTFVTDSRISFFNIVIYVIFFSLLILIIGSNVESFSNILLEEKNKNVKTEFQIK